MVKHPLTNRALLALPVVAIILFGCCLVTFVTRTVAQGVPVLDALGNLLDPLVWPYWWAFSLAYFAGLIVCPPQILLRKYWLGAAYGAVLGVACAVVASTLSAFVYSAAIDGEYRDPVGTAIVYFALSALQLTPAWSAVLFLVFRALVLRASQSKAAVPPLMNNDHRAGMSCRDEAVGSFTTCSGNAIE